MSESIIHINLVKGIKKWLIESNIVDEAAIFTSLPESNTENKCPRFIDGREPDVYAKDLRSKLLIIGEAKTENDIFTAHSKAQYISYLNYAQNYYNETLIVYSVPSMCKVQMKNHINNLYGQIPSKVKVIIV